MRNPLHRVEGFSKPDPTDEFKTRPTDEFKTDPTDEFKTRPTDELDSPHAKVFFAQPTVFIGF
ncbi:hypothetical protein FHS57_003302 [Runella defluvii]|uniref:Uncharacterized protein n=1 Tax=Runella defluvii TaxID=370973 RepID=A0A7W6ERD4_9BACT|nr:hypothetical protein [Runella defluvii]MBB3839296.1 hypothetical protein [Runella defluvii]